MSFTKWFMAIFDGTIASGLLICLVITSLIVSSAASAQNLIRDRIKSRFANIQNESGIGGFTKCELAGLQCAVWVPSDTTEPAPLIVFSHGFKGKNTQSAFIMQALAKAGYIVVAPNHKDSLEFGNVGGKPDEDFKAVLKWSDKTYRDRGDDIVNVLAALHKDSRWDSKIDWSRVGLAGHSLGGYTVLALGGAWPSWKLPEVKAVLALSPYCAPFSMNGDLAGMRVPVMYQGGTRDFGITPTVKRPNGAYQKTGKPAYFVDFDNFTHLSWTGFNRDQKQKDLTDYYSVAFFNKYLKNDPTAKPETKLPGVVELDVK